MRYCIHLNTAVKQKLQIQLLSHKIDCLPGKYVHSEINSFVKENVNVQNIFANVNKIYE